MSRKSADVEVAVVGAGAAGIGAARTLREAGISFALLEASHRIGGRAYTEQAAPGQPFDLGCHWLHSASLNPFVQIADELGFEYSKAGFPPMELWQDGDFLGEQENQDRSAFIERSFDEADEAGAGGRDVAVVDVTERDNRWTPVFDYFLSLTSSLDSDQVSTLDLANYRDTVENWPLKQGYGALVARHGADLPVALNSAVTKIDWSADPIRLTTARGTLSARRIILTVSTGILGAGDIAFQPALPLWKQEAIAALPLGNHNRLCLTFERNPFGPEHPKSVLVTADDTEPLMIRLRPFGYDHVVGLTGGRFADWLERAGQAASVDLMKEKLAQVFGSAVPKRMTGQIVTAWREDPWVRGAYSSALPGQAHQRVALARSLDQRILFAGEATSPEFFSTAHGAYLSGIRAAGEITGPRSGLPGSR
ncbi:MAG: NAD(P)/FAD-dependent oxidoreductase [Pseudomonadota bacterium]